MAPCRQPSQLKHTQQRQQQLRDPMPVFKFNQVVLDETVELRQELEEARELIARLKEKELGRESSMR